MKPWRLIEADIEPHAGRWYIGNGIQRRLVLSRAALEGTPLEFEIPTKVTIEELLKMSPASPVSRVSTKKPKWFLKSSLDMRQALTGSLSGTGVEFGAGGSPLPVPLAAESLFSDFFDQKGLVENRYEGQELSEILAPDFQIGLEEADLLPIEDLDFIIACHVIEHVANPVKAIIECLGKLRPGGKLILIVPDMRKTFDRNRELTSIKHLVSDYLSPDRNEDYKHFVDFYENAMPPEDRSLIPQLVKEKFEENFPIHYHTFTHKSFRKLLREIKRNQSEHKFKFWTRGPRYTEVDIEFYVCIQRLR